MVRHRTYLQGIPNTPRTHSNVAVQSQQRSQEGGGGDDKTVFSHDSTWTDADIILIFYI